eukprot:PLAT3009.1.p1 GENE.PLAT3009.1~~PLAT3009.1.p1  ORF type:complete len:172 (-),score=74.46 PLAT3009.1:173-688(-)
MRVSSSLLLLCLAFAGAASAQCVVQRMVQPCGDYKVLVENNDPVIKVQENVVLPCDEVKDCGQSVYESCVAVRCTGLALTNREAKTSSPACKTAAAELADDQEATLALQCRGACSDYFNSIGSCTNATGDLGSQVCEPYPEKDCSGASQLTAHFAIMLSALVAAVLLALLM